MSQVFSFLVEPSSYTMDLVDNVYKKLGINYKFIYASSLAKTLAKNDIESLSRLGLFAHIGFVISIFKKNRLIIVNGYNRWEFVLLFLLNIFSFNKRILAIESDTQFREISGLKGIIKSVYLKTIFMSDYTMGFPGGNDLHSELFRYYGMSEERIFLMPMMVNNQKFFRHIQKDESEAFTFLYVGRIIPHKNVNLLIENFLKIFTNNENVLLRIVGTGSDVKKLTDKFKAHENIIFEGAKYDQDLILMYHTSNVLVLPSMSEPWGLVVNEAMSAGLPVIASNKVGAIQDLIVGKETGFIFDIEKKNELSQKMLQIYEDQSLYTEYSQNAVQLMKEYWNYTLYKKNLLAAIAYADKILDKGQEL